MAAEVDLVISGPIRRAHIRGICRRVGSLLNRTDGTPLVCDVGALAEADAESVDTLARLQLIVRRVGRELRLRNASEELTDLISMMGLCEVLRLEPSGQTEKWEQPSRIEKEADPGDPSV